MEFSFDRSRQSNPNSQKTANTSVQNEEIDTTTIANERLRKAIERNRSRQKDREQQTATTSTSTTASAQQSAWAQHQAHTNANPSEQMEEPKAQETLFEQETIAPKVERIRREPPPMATRRTVARPEDTEFAPIKRPAKKVASQISYTTGSKRKSAELDPKYINYLVKGSWIFCGFLVLRLIFSNGGVVDYFSQKSILTNRFSELTRIRNENMSLVHEIERMQLDVGYQKKLVRDNLGFIAQDEFLILFPQDRTN